jgi:hypothetical protein
VSVWFVSAAEAELSIAMEEEEEDLVGKII